MSFTKRHLNYNTLRSIFEEHGYKSLRQYICKPDALYVGDPKANTVLEIIRSDNSEDEQEKSLKNFFYSN